MTAERAKKILNITASTIGSIREILMHIIDENKTAFDDVLNSRTQDPKTTTFVRETLEAYSYLKDHGFEITEEEIKEPVRPSFFIIRNENIEKDACHGESYLYFDENMMPMEQTLEFDFISKIENGYCIARKSGNYYILNIDFMPIYQLEIDETVEFLKENTLLISRPIKNQVLALKEQFVLFHEISTLPYFEYPKISLKERTKEQKIISLDGKNKTNYEDFTQYVIPNSDLDFMFAKPTSDRDFCNSYAWSTNTDFGKLPDHIVLAIQTKEQKSEYYFINTNTYETFLIHNRSHWFGSYLYHTLPNGSVQIFNSALEEVINSDSYPLIDCPIYGDIVKIGSYDERLSLRYGYFDLKKKEPFLDPHYDEVGRWMCDWGCYKKNNKWFYLGLDQKTFEIEEKKWPTICSINHLGANIIALGEVKGNDIADKIEHEINLYNKGYKSSFHPTQLYFDMENYRNGWRTSHTLFHLDQGLKSFGDTMFTQIRPFKLGRMTGRYEVGSSSYWGIFDEEGNEYPIYFPSVKSLKELKKAQLEQEKKALSYVSKCSITNPMLLGLGSAVSQNLPLLSMQTLQDLLPLSQALSCQSSMEHTTEKPTDKHIPKLDIDTITNFNDSGLAIVNDRYVVNLEGQIIFTKPTTESIQIDNCNNILTKVPFGEQQYRDVLLNLEGNVIIPPSLKIESPYHGIYIQSNTQYQCYDALGIPLFDEPWENIWWTSKIAFNDDKNGQEIPVLALKRCGCTYILEPGQDLKMVTQDQTFYREFQFLLEDNSSKVKRIGEK